MLSVIFLFCKSDIAPSSQCEMKFAHIREANISHLQSKYFHSEAISLARKANFVEKRSKIEVKLKKRSTKL